MTRRERHLRIIENFGSRSQHQALDRLLARKGLTILSDDGVEQLVRLTLSDWQHHKRCIEHNRKLAQAAGAKHV